MCVDELPAAEIVIFQYNHYHYTVLFCSYHVVYVLIRVVYVVIEYVRLANMFATNATP